MPAAGPPAFKTRIRGRVSQSVALGALALAVALALWHFPGAFSKVSRDTGGLERAGALDRRLAGARNVDVDTRVFVEARRLIPEQAAYAVVTGREADVSTPVTLAAIRPFAAYWLLPRRQLADPAEADWVVSYGGDLRRLGLSYRRVVEAAPGIAVAEIRR